MSGNRGSSCLSARYADLSGRRVLITGGASGIGLCMAEAFAAQGCDVTAIDKDADAIASASGRLAGGAVTFVEADLADAESEISAINGVLAHGPVDILIANAANDNRHAWNEVTPQSWRDALSINIDHQFFAAQAVAKAMADVQRPGTVILMGSVAARRGRPAMAAYLTSKAAIEGLTRALARELGPLGIRVAAILPGAISTERQQRLWRTPESERMILKEQALPILLDGWDVAGMALFLASDAARGCTGQCYVVDAGFS